MATHSLSFFSDGMGNRIDTLTVGKAFDGGPIIEGFGITIATDVQYDLAFLVADLETVFMYATCDCTIETNSGTVPDDTFTMLANEPLVWWNGAPWANPFTVDVAAFFITSAATGSLYARFGTDQ